MFNYNNENMSMENKLCVNCKSEMNKGDSFCSKCGSKNYVWTTGKKILLIAVVSIVGIIFIGSTDNSSSNDSAYNRKISSIVFAENIIEGILKSPSTAKFVDVQAYELSEQKDIWTVNGYVDSQNSFGAMLRSSWEVQLDYRDGKGGTVKSVLFDGNRIK